MSTETILSNIQQLQQHEKQLLNNLQINMNMSTNERETILQQLNQLSSLRIQLYKSLNKLRVDYDITLENTLQWYKDQTKTIEIVENDLIKQKKQLLNLEHDKQNKIRLSEINTYFANKYEEHTNLIKIIIITLIPIIIIQILHRYFLSFIPNSIILGVCILIAIIGSTFIISRIMSMYMRNNMNYQIYDWAFNPSQVETTTTTENENEDDPWETNKIIGTCIGSNCCGDGLIYDSSLNVCVLSK